MTLNQTIKQLRSIITNHGQIQSFYYGDIVNWTEFTDLKYVSCVLTLNDAVRASPTTKLNFSLWISDRLLPDNSNRNDVLSDTLQILVDIISKINDIDNDWFPDLDNRQIVFYEDERGNDNADVVAGVKFDFAISIAMPKDWCQVPYHSDFKNAGLFFDGVSIYGGINSQSFTRNNALIGNLYVDAPSGGDAHINVEYSGKITFAIQSGIIGTVELRNGGDVIKSFDLENNQIVWADVMTQAEFDSMTEIYVNLQYLMDVLSEDGQQVITEDGQDIVQRES